MIGLPNEGTLDLLLLGDLVWGIDCHWQPPCEAMPKGGTVLCHAFYRDCEHCGVLRKVWTGFTPVWQLRQKKQYVFRAGEKTIKAIGAFAGKLVTWHGLAVRIGKVGSGKTAGAYCEPYPGAMPKPIPYAHPMGRTLRRVLRTDVLPDFTLDAEESLDVPLSDENGGP